MRGLVVRAFARSHGIQSFRLMFSIYFKRIGV